MHVGAPICHGISFWAVSAYWNACPVVFFVVFWERVLRVSSEFIVVRNIWYQSQRWPRKIAEVKPDLIGGVTGVINIVEHTP